MGIAALQHQRGNSILLEISSMKAPSGRHVCFVPDASKTLSPIGAACLFCAGP
ncbi:MAG: hypothetical protein RLZZ543_1102 [Bacteroidota bacterium]|jgi:hypothetical protein